MVGFCGPLWTARVTFVISSHGIKAQRAGERRKKGSRNRPSTKHAVPSMAAKGSLETDCIEPTITDYGSNAGKRVKATALPFLSRSLQCYVLDAKGAQRSAQDVSIIHCALCTQPLGIFFNGPFRL